MDSRSGDSTPVQGGPSSRQIQRLPSLRSLGSLYNAVTSPLRPTNPPRKASDADSISADDDMSLEPIAHPPAHQHQQPQQPTASQIHLSTQCQSCGETVAVQVPDWMLSAHARITDYEQAAAAQQQQSARPRSRSDLRDKLVQGAVSGAVAFKNSPVLPFLLAIMRAVFAFVIYLDMRFALHQKMLFILSAFLEGLIEIEREVGIFRGLGHTMSILWEATVKGTIALAKSEPEPVQPIRMPAPVHHASPQLPAGAASGFGSPYTISARNSRDSSPNALAAANGTAGGRQRLTRSSHSTTSLPLLLSTSSSSHLLPPVDIHSPTAAGTSSPRSNPPPDYQTTVSSSSYAGSNAPFNKSSTSALKGDSGTGASAATKRKNRNSLNAGSRKGSHNNSDSDRPKSRDSQNSQQQQQQQGWGGRLVGAVTNRIPTGFSHDTSAY